MSATPVEQPGQNKDSRVGAADVAQAGRHFLDAYVSASVADAEGLLAAVDQREWSAMWLAVDEAAQEFGRALTRPTALQQSAPDVALLARLEAAEGEGARLRRALKPFAQEAIAAAPGSGLDVIGLYVRRGAVRDACDVLAPLAQSEGLPS